MWTERLCYEQDTLLCEALSGQVIRHGTILIAEIVNKTSQESTAGVLSGAAEHMRSGLILVHFLFSVFEFLCGRMLSGTMQGKAGTKWPTKSSGTPLQNPNSV